MKWLHKAMSLGDMAAAEKIGQLERLSKEDKILLQFPSLRTEQKFADLSEEHH